jgi:diguanylate cyclase
MPPAAHEIETGTALYEAPPSDVALGDWDVLLGAVRDRLNKVGGKAGAPGHAPLGFASPERVGMVVAECVMALDQLHLTLAHELGRCDELLRQAELTRQELARLQSELLDSRAVEKQTRHMALHDALTALPNRLHFQQRLAQAVLQSQGQPLAVLYLDLDGLKPINDRHGHGTGDALLRIVATRLTRAMRAEDVVSRMGGDEFACLLAHPSERNQLLQRACALFDAVAAPLQIGALQLQVRASIGVAVYPHDGQATAELLKNADTAMYNAKRSQTGVAFYSST